MPRPGPGNVTRLTPGKSVVSTLTNQELGTLFNVISRLRTVRTPLVVPYGRGIGKILYPFARLGVQDSVHP